MALVVAHCERAPSPTGAGRKRHVARVVPTSEYRIATSSDFFFRIDDLEWEIGGSEVFAIDHVGRFTHVYPHAVRDGDAGWEWREASRSLAPSELAELRSMLERGRFPELLSAYRVPNLEDGSQTTFWLRSGGHLKRVHCHNRYPDPVRRVLAFVRALVREDDASRVITEEEAREYSSRPPPLP
jgi:hypothetical protein